MSTIMVAEFYLCCLRLENMSTDNIIVPQNALVIFVINNFVIYVNIIYYNVFFLFNIQKWVVYYYPQISFSLCYSVSELFLKFYLAEE